MHALALSSCTHQILPHHTMADALPDYMLDPNVVLKDGK